jgi:chromosome segregation ATPase
MATTIEDIDRRVIALERAQTAAGGALDRIDRKVDHASERVSVLDAKVDAMHRIIAESEARTAKRIMESELRIGAKVAESEQRLENRLAGIEHSLDGVEHRLDGKIDRVLDVLNERFNEMMTALDGLTNPPK